MAALADILAAFERNLTLERELGTRTVECDRALLTPSRAETPVTPTPPPVTPAPPPVKPVPPPVKPVPPPESVSVLETDRLCETNQEIPRPAPVPARGATLEAIAEEVAACTACELHAHRTHVVPGQGNGTRPDFMFVGEAPGADEDLQGLAFVGAAGQFLTKMIAAMGYTREDVFIANICKCRPPNNRTPVPQEMATCVPFLKRQIALVKPRCLVLLGRTAMTGLFPEQRLRRGVWYEYEGIPTIATFHPSYIIRFESARDPEGLRAAKIEVWNTLKSALARLGKKPPAKS